MLGNFKIMRIANYYEYYYYTHSAFRYRCDRSTVHIIMCDCSLCYICHTYILSGLYKLCHNRTDTFYKNKPEAREEDENIKKKKRGERIVNE